MADKYFVNCSEEGFETFSTLEEAKEEAQRRVDDEGDMAVEGWSDNVETITWGEIKQVTKAFDHKNSDEAEEEGIYIGSCDYYCDYELVDLK